LAGEGTLFLDEVGDLAPESQGKLLRVLQERRFRRVGGTTELPFQARVVAATHVDLATAAQQGRFREDLYYRLAVVPIHLHPLRERPVDILPLAEHFLRQLARELNCACPALTAEHQRLLQAHSWPGNVRELRNVMERFVLMGGQLEFVAPARKLDEKVGATGGRCPETPPVEGSEREMLYDVLLRRLLGEDEPASAAVQTAV
jgi:transcriptional regulator with PAS, ATPase and Fis domain